MIDQSKKMALIAHIKQRQKSNDEEILLAPDLYFDGYNDDHCTICANLSTPISTSRFVGRLRELQQRPDVSGVFVRFTDYSDALDSDELWISSDSVYIITSAGLDVVREWFIDFEISDVWEETDVTKFADLPRIPNGFRLVAVWWD